MFSRPLKASACKRSNSTIKKIMESYENRTTSLSIGDQKIEITEELIRVIFGIVDGDVQIEIGKKGRCEVEFIDRLFPEYRSTGNKLTKSRIEKEIKVTEIRSHDFARLAVLYVLAYALAPTNGYSFGWHYTQFVEDVDAMCKYNWSLFIYDMLMAGMNKQPKGAMGCVLILAYCLCECSRIITPLHSSAVPRCVKWDLKELTKALKGKDLEDFFLKVKDYSGETEEEKRLLHLPHDMEANEPFRSGSEKEKEKIRLKVRKQGKLIKKQRLEIGNLKSKLEGYKKLRSKFRKQAKLIEEIKDLEETLAKLIEHEKNENDRKAQGEDRKFDKTRRRRPS